MSLDIRLFRDVNNSWGFELAGGAEDEVTLTVQKVKPESPASRAGLQNGDAVLSINGEESIDFSNEEACRRVAEGGDTLIFRVVRGLYDPVLDDQEPICYEPGDLDPQSQPTEVPFKIQRFLEPEDLGSKVINYESNGEPLGQPYDPSVLLIESRSLTASPFVNPSKPYRPFSTEPIPQIPDLEDPIILNPEYKDQFGKGLDDINPDYLLNVIPNGSAKFKLPISEQYDPDGTKKVKNTEIDSVLSKYIKMEKLSKETKVINGTVTEKRNEKVNAEETILKDNKERVNNVKIIVESQEIHAEEQKNVKVVKEKQTEHKIIKKELSYNDQMKKEIDITKIEDTAISVVDDNIERAIAVTEEIKKVIEEELATEMILKTENSFTESEEKMFSTKQEVNEEKSAESVTKIENKQSRDMNEISSKEEYMNDENITVRKETSSNIKNEKATNDVTNVYRKAHDVNAEEDKKSFSKEILLSENKSEIKSTKHVTGSKAEISDAQKRTYTIGLQTIPHIRGVAHSSHHYDLLLRTFFIHLTDVMVALSRFVLTQPIFNAETHENISKTEINQASTRIVRTNQEDVFNTINKVKNKKVDESNTQTELQQKKNIESVTEAIVNEKKKDQIVQTVEQNVNVNENRIKTRELVTPVEFKENITVGNAHTLEQQNLEETAVTIEKKIKSGSQMAQRTERKLTKDVTQKMDSVISEFQTIAVEGDKKEMFQRNRRSRSRSQIEEEVARENDPLEWLSKVDSQTASQEFSEEKIAYKKESSSLEKIDKKYLEKHEIKHKKYKPPKQMYLAIVEAHVYTNKDVIFEDAAEFSETSSVQSADETNIALESLETMSIENVAIEKAVQQIEHAKIVEDTKELAKFSTQSTATVRDIQETVIESKSSVQEEFKQEVVHQTQSVIEPVVEIKELVSKEDITVSIDESQSITEDESQSSEINIHKSENELTAVEIKNESVTRIDEKYAQSAVIEEVIETKHTEIDTKDINTKPGVQIAEIYENVIVKSQKEDVAVGEEYATLKIRKEVESEIESTNEIIEIEEVYDVSHNISEDAVINKIELSKAVILDESEKLTEISVANTVYGLNKCDVSNTSESIINSETDVKLSIDNLSETYINNVSSSLQESSFTAQFTDKKLTLQTDLHTQTSTDSVSSTIDTPTPSTVPPTPLTDEYVFKLSIPLPKSRGNTPIPRDCTLIPEEEDPQIVKKKLIPHIETTIEKVVYDTPLPTPPGDKVQSPLYKIPGLFGGSKKFKPVYRKPGLFGGADNADYSKEEIREIERKSSLLASAIDETIKSIEEYKEEVGIEKKKEVKIKKEESTDIKEEKISKSFKETSIKNTIMQSKQNGFLENSEITNEIIQNGVDSIDTVNSNPSISIEEHAINKILDSTAKSSEKEESLDSTKRSEKEAIEISGEVKQTSNEANETKKIEIAEALKTELQKQTFDTKAKIIVNGINNENVVAIDDKINDTLKKMDEKSEIIENGYKETDFNEMNNIAVSKMDEIRVNDVEERRDPMLGFRSVVFEPETVPKLAKPTVPKQGPTIQEGRQSPYVTESGDIIGTIQGIVDGLEETLLDAEVARELGKPGITEQKIAELISGEAEMLREAHVMGLSRVLNSHMHRADNSSVDFEKIKPMIGSLKDSEVLKVLNEELARQKEIQKKKEEKKWTTFLQKPKRPVPKAKFGYHGWTAAEQVLVEEPYKVKIVKQAKPKVAPDYKPEDFETGPLPWEERAEIEASLPPVEPEEPILIPEVPEFLEAVDPLKESEVPDLEDTGIPLPPPKEPTPPPVEPVQEELLIPEEPEEEVIEDTQQEVEVIKMENNLAEQLVKNVQSMVDPNASLEQQLSQMRAQLSALAQLPEVIQQTLDLVSKQLNKITQQEITESAQKEARDIEVNQNHVIEASENGVIQNGDGLQNPIEKENGTEEGIELIEDNLETGEPQIVQDRRVLQTPVITEDVKFEKMKKEQVYKNKLESEARQIKQRPTPRVGKPKRMFGPLDPDSRPVVLPGGRRWRKTEDVYNEQLIAETLQAQSELLQGKIMGFESDLLPYDDRINFMKYEKPPVSLDHLAQSETYKLVHDMDQAPLKRVELLTPVIAEADYRERCRSMTPSGMKHMQIPQQFHP